MAPIIPGNLSAKVKKYFKLRRQANGELSDDALNDRNVTTSSIAHIFLGGISQAAYTKNEPVGMHTITPGFGGLILLEPDQEPKEKTEQNRAVRPFTTKDDPNYTGPGKNGVYKAKVWLKEAKFSQWRTKDSTMFPANWSQEQVIDVINRSYIVADRIVASGGTETWEGRDPITKTMIVIICLPNGDIITAYPKYERE
ncbi:hypothetical protein EXW34_30325 (plasmid) [Bacillus mycoides]|uniref:EndoU domain-containing protein n=1 Tax=Bacillus mycoides TaxID=1405 RepID=UPI0002799C14|nr:EndoU domain-containing protein [Bacillus mycoides]EJR95867.1 hypothetical protein IKO_05664 [Bacillus cereus VDM034]QWI25475.1 hypothetical protein EXW34_30325 [Bacillus mycoides]